MLSEILKSLREEKEISIEKLSKELNIPASQITHLEEGDFSKMPAKVFIRGYLIKLSDFFDVDFDGIWNEFLKQYSGGKKYLPAPKENQKKTSKKNKYLKIIPIILISIAIIIFLGNQAKILLWPPKLDIQNPRENMITQDEQILVSGWGRKNSHITINGQKIYLGDDGFFQENVYLKMGVNEIRIEAKNSLGKTKTIQRMVTRRYIATEFIQ